MSNTKDIPKKFNDLPDLLKATEVAAILRVSPKFVYNNLFKKKDFPVIKIGEKKLLVPKEHLKKWLEDKNWPLSE